MREAGIEAGKEKKQGKVCGDLCKQQKDELKKWMELELIKIKRATATCLYAIDDKLEVSMDAIAYDLRKYHAHGVRRSAWHASRERGGTCITSTYIKLKSGVILTNILARQVLKIHGCLNDETEEMSWPRSPNTYYDDSESEVD